MAYIGNQVTSVPFTIDTFSGTGSATVFGQLIRAPASVASIAVYISGVYKVPGVDYTLNGDFIIFTSAPASGTNNIIVHHMGNGSATQVPSDGSVTGAKLSANVVRGNNIVAGQITGNLIGINAVSINNFSSGTITSNVLASNLSISLTRAAESANINVIAPGGNVNIDIANNVVYYFNANSTANITFNLRANTRNTFDSVTTIGQSVTVAMVVRHGTTRHVANVYIDGGLITTPAVRTNATNVFVYLGNTKPNFQSITNEETNIYGYTILKTAANAYTVLASNSLFALG
jgi:hypothetical protein